MKKKQKGYVYKNKKQERTAYYNLVESFREGGKVKQRTMMSPGRAEDGTLDQLAEAIGNDVKDTYILSRFLSLKEWCRNWTFRNVWITYNKGT